MGNFAYRFRTCWSEAVCALVSAVDRELCLFQNETMWRVLSSNRTTTIKSLAAMKAFVH